MKWAGELGGRMVEIFPEIRSRELTEAVVSDRICRGSREEGEA
jgi:hypothetical protein